MERLARFLCLCVLLIGIGSSGALGFTDNFNALDPAVWAVYANGGSVSVANGTLSLSTNGVQPKFPYLTCNVNPFPALGDFTVRLGIRFTQLEMNGTGFHATTALPAPPVYDQINMDPGCVLSYWGDSGANGGVGTTYHSVEWHYAGGTVEQYVDGQLSQTQYGCQRPAGIWLGSPLQYAGCVPWTALEIDYIEVVPEPSSVLALVCGVGGFAGMMWRRKSA